MMKRLIRILLRIVLIIPVTVLFLMFMAVGLLIQFAYWLFEIPEMECYTNKDANNDFVRLYKTFWKTFLN